MYLDSVLNKDTKKGIHSKAVSREQGNASWKGNILVVVWEGGKKSAEVGGVRPWSGGFTPGRIAILFSFRPLCT